MFGDLRAGSARFPGLTVTTAEASDGRLTTVISEMSSYFDRLAGDHFETTASTTFIFDGPHAPGEHIIEFNRRIQTCTGVQLVGADHATFTTLPVTGYLIHSSFTQPSSADIGPYYGEAGWDGLELIGGGDGSLGGGASSANQWSLPTWSRAIAVTGNWDWPSCPELVAEAVAWLVIEMLRTTQLPAGVKSFNSGRAQFQVEDEAPGDYTGISVVDRALKVYGRKASSIEAI